MLLGAARRVFWLNMMGMAHIFDELENKHDLPPLPPIIIDLERELNKWISQFVTEDDNPSKGVRERRPLRMAKIEVSDVEGEPGWYRVGMQVRPHFKYMGAHFTLSLVGKLDK